MAWRLLKQAAAAVQRAHSLLLAVWLFLPLCLLSACQALASHAYRAAGGVTFKLRPRLETCVAARCLPEGLAQRRLGLGLARFRRTVEIAFENSSYWRALVLLDIWAWLAVWRTHEASHADAISAAVVEEAAPGALSRKRRQAVSTHLLSEAAIAALHAKAAYGHLAVTGAVDSWQGFLQLLTVKSLGRQAVRRITPEQHIAALGLLTGVQPGDVLAARWRSLLHQPAYYVCLDRAFQCIVVAIRGTVQMGDYLTVLDAAPEPITLAGVAGHAHAGMLASAQDMLDEVVAALQAAGQHAPGWPILLTGHSLGGGISALLTLMLEELRQRGDERVSGLGQFRSISIGTAAATCQQLGEACRDSVTSVVYGADALPMFSIRGARMLIDDVNSSSRVASLVTRVVGRRERAAAQLQKGAAAGGAASVSVAAAAGLAAAGAAAAAADQSQSKHCGIVCGARCSGLCRASDGEGAAAAGGAQPQQAAEASRQDKAAAVAAAAAATLHERSPSVASDWSDWSSSPSVAGAGEGGLMMYPPGRLLWLLPSGGAQQGQGRQRQAARQQHGDGPHVVVEADQSLFRRFLLLPSTALHHVPRTYLRALQGLLRAGSSPA